jgi:hypothetical protein
MVYTLTLASPDGRVQRVAFRRGEHGRLYTPRGETLTATEIGARVREWIKRMPVISD